MLKNIEIEIPFSNPQQFLALTGVSVEIFNKILPFFDSAEKEIAYEKYEERMRVHPMFTRKPSILRQQGMLTTPESKLYFILFYYKNYCLQQVMANKFRMSVSSANKNIHKYSGVLKRALSTMGVLPMRSIVTPEDISQLFENNEEIFIDVTERPINRPSDYQEQKNNFSGKKKQHTNKNLVISTKEKSVKYLGLTTEGTQHDYSMLKKELPPNKNIFEGKEINVDLGFNGVKKEYKAKKIRIPHKKPRKSKSNPNPTLTEKQKKENRRFAKIRIVVEHAIGGIKIMHILKIKFRNWVNGFIDEVMEVSTGIWNLKLSN